MRELWEATFWFIAIILAYAGLWCIFIEPDKVAAFCFLILASQWVAIAKLEGR